MSVSSLLAKRRANLAVVVVACGMIGAISGGETAHAADHFCVGNNVLAGWTCASGGAYGGGIFGQRMFVGVNVDHTACAVAALGYGGYNSAPQWDVDSIPLACTNGSGTNGACFSTVNRTAHGAVGNQNISTTVHVYDAHVTYPTLNC